MLSVAIISSLLIIIIIVIIIIIIIIYIFGGYCHLTEFCNVQNSLRVQVLRSGPALGMYQVFGRTGPPILGGRQFWDPLFSVTYLFSTSNEGDGTVDDESDIDGQSLYYILKTLANILLQNTVSPLEFLRCVFNNGLQELLPNLAVALRILLTVPVTVASGGRSFSRLKLIKTFLRSMMSQDRLVGLAILSIENDVVQTVDFADLLPQFASS